MLIQNFSLLADEARFWVARHGRPYDVPAAVSPEHRWIIRSALQKAVRRGQCDRAIKYALSLDRLDRRYAWRALLTVATEDVGVGCPDAVLWATAAQSAKFRDLIGPIPLLVAVTAALASSIKSRAACDLSFVVETGEPDMVQLVAQEPLDNLLDDISGHHPYRAFTALAAIRRPPDLFSARRHSDIDAVCEVIRDLLPERLSRMALAAYRKPLDSMSFGLVSAAFIAAREDQLTLVEDAIPPSGSIGGYPAEAYDQHERIGREAIWAFARSLENENAIAEKLGWGRWKRAVADAVFLEEGQLLDRWWSVADFVRLRHEADGFSLSRHGVLDAEAAALRKRVRDGLEGLNDLRAKAVSGRV